MEMSSYITGFVDGEGSFLVSFSKREKLSVGIEVRPSFSISQHERNKDILFQLQKYFGCGGIRYSKRDQNYRYEVRSLKDLLEKIVPHFDVYPLQTSKQRDFEMFKNVCFLMKANEHLSFGGVSHIIEMGYQMNNLGSRRYTKEILLKSIAR
ncbi:MAG: endonuclease [Candidatus Magasanikbacteria bacterium CG10_big_fil_rev_8_21_14_0_10_47_10]|uniref:Endonuclease n=1 Tax=Candidatus Magasanikbacteria bacterium CG10_big_fil_rev_8_21_14_0_10_47_10 TaxID=1974652 RepID=A0A2H0TR89_9BACT|nr:MAG: endonuclease [Candidatus Magasanikbacteria bacterium CG10_big_fil_rev_8_21_14_0_10_47_10]